MSKEEQIISLKMFINRAVGMIYRMSPYLKPRKIDEIVADIKTYFETNGKHHGDWYYITIEKKDRYELVEKILKGSQAFNELNLSKVEFEGGVTMEDENRTPFGFVSRDMKIKEEHDFVDLDACVRNINGELYWDWLDDEMFEGRAEVVLIEKKEGEQDDQ